MLGYLSVNGTLTFKKSYNDGDYYDLEYLAQHSKSFRGNAKLKAKKGKGSRVYTMNRRARKRIENGTILMRHHQDKKNYTIKMLTLTFAQKPKEANKKVSAFFNRIMKDKIIQNYWWVKEYHPEHFENTGEKKEHYHCLISIKRYMTKIKILELWQLQAGIDTIIISLDNIRVTNKYKSFLFQIVMYVSKYSTKGIDKFNDRAYGMSKQLSKQDNIPIIYAKTIDNLLAFISKNADLTVNEVIHYREHWNQAYLTVKKAKTYFKIKKEMENDKIWQTFYYTDTQFKLVKFREKFFTWLFDLKEEEFESEKTKQDDKERRKKDKQLEIKIKDYNLKSV